MSYEYVSNRPVCHLFVCHLFVCHLFVTCHLFVSLSPVCLLLLKKADDKGPRDYAVLQQ
jgi:hypothetical protein